MLLGSHGVEERNGDLVPWIDGKKFRDISLYRKWERLVEILLQTLLHNQQWSMDILCSLGVGEGGQGYFYPFHEIVKWTLENPNPNKSLCLCHKHHFIIFRWLFVTSFNWEFFIGSMGPVGLHDGHNRWLNDRKTLNIQLLDISKFHDLLVSSISTNIE